MLFIWFNLVTDIELGFSHSAPISTFFHYLFVYLYANL